MDIVLDMEYVSFDLLGFVREARWARLPPLLLSHSFDRKSGRKASHVNSA
jgi:hypothetical protein